MAAFFFFFSFKLPDASKRTFLLRNPILSTNFFLSFFPFLVPATQVNEQYVSILVDIVAHDIKGFLTVNWEGGKMSSVVKRFYLFLLKRTLFSERMPNKIRRRILSVVVALFSFFLVTLLRALEWLEVIRVFCLANKLSVIDLPQLLALIIIAEIPLISSMCLTFTRFSDVARFNI